MKTTIELPEQLFKQAKMEALKKGISLKELFITALENELNATKTNTSEFSWKDLLHSGSASNLSPNQSGFDDEHEPEWIHALQVNEPTSK